MGFVEEYQELLRKGDKRQLLDHICFYLPFQSLDGNLEVGRLSQLCKPWRWRSWWAIRDKPLMIAKINQRLISKVEVVLDYDPGPDETEDHFKKRIKQSIKKIKEADAGVMGIFSTGSRGVHVHVYLPELYNCSDKHTHKVKSFIIKKFGGDLMKAGLRTMIACELSPHWKTGMVKRLLE